MYSEQGYWILYVPALRKLSAYKLKTYLAIFFEERLVEDVPNYNKALLEQLYQLLMNETEPNAEVMLGAGWRAIRQYDFVYIQPDNFVASVPKTGEIRLEAVNQWYSLSDGEELALFEVDEVTLRMRSEADHMLALDLTGEHVSNFYLRHRQDGDEMLVVQNGQPTFHKKISRMMIDNKIPANQRDAMWLLCTQDHQIVWLIPLKYSGLYQPQQTDTITHIFLYRKVRK